ncbi:MAG: Rrf2 family transcriptional regulator [Bdellovibrionales bacterium]|nr:Rrf2 family transcriptional regulator [Bdellovibrionales bacterium]
MVRINRKLEYALMVLKYMSAKAPSELTTAKEVADFIKGPFDTIAKVMQQMVHSELLRSEQGVQGGYFLATNLNKLNLFKLNEVVSGPMELVKCFDEDHHCELSSHCNIQSPLVTLNRKLIDFFQELSISELLRIKSPLSAKSQSVKKEVAG